MTPHLTVQEVWALVVQHEKLLKSLVRKRLPRHRFRELDDLYAEVVLMRAQDIMRLYDPNHESKATPITYLARNIEWYAFEKIRDIKYKKRIVADSLDHAVMSGVTEPVHNDTIQVCIETESLLSQLPLLARNILEWRYVKDYDIREIAKYMKLRHREVLGVLNWAEQCARDVVDGVLRKDNRFASYGKDKP